MKTNTMPVRLPMTVAIIIAAILSIIPVARSQQDTKIPLIVMDNVPLMDAIKNLARQAGINYIIDPRVLTNYSEMVSVRLENKTAEQALSMMLTNHNLTLIEIPATTIAQVTHQKQNEKPVYPKQIGKDTGTVIPLIVMDEVPLADAIQNLARQAQLDVTIDPKVSQPPPNAKGVMAFPPTVSVRWEHVTPKQALAAIVDNYELVMTQDGDKAQIAPKTAAAK
jgi:type II secretory pathway component GspD/PulD (secretin)